jgi:hypothetical protein
MVFEVALTAPLAHVGHHLAVCLLQCLPSGAELLFVLGVGLEVVLVVVEQLLRWSERP